MKLSELDILMADNELKASGIENPSSAQITMQFVRKTRKALLKQTDWMAGSDVTMSDDWKKYRQDLRDLPASNSDPSKIVFPTKPE